MEIWLKDTYDYNLGKYVKLRPVGYPSAITAACNRSLDKVVNINGEITRERWYIIPNDAVLRGNNGD